MYKNTVYNLVIKRFSKLQPELPKYKEIDVLKHGIF